MHLMSSLTNSSPEGEDVVISAADAREIARLLRLLDAARRADLTPAELKRRARAVISERGRRAQFFGRAMLGEPAWDILLQLYVSDHGVLAIRDVVLMTEEPKSTAIRWIAYLEEKGLVGRRPDPVDRRLIQVELLERGRALLDGYFRETPWITDSVD